MRFFISVVSHEDHNIIKDLDSLRRLTRIKNVVVICRDNLPNRICRDYCEKHGVHYIENINVKGFSTNNNANFIYAKTHLGMTDNDYFILMNPDIFIDEANIAGLLKSLVSERPSIVSPCLYLDIKQKVYDDNLRQYPKLKNFIKNYLFHDRSTVINKDSEEPNHLSYWVSAAFVCILSQVYEELGGFDESYHMYCEDVDFCLRALQSGYKPNYFSSIKAVHLHRRSSKKFLSRPFFWHVKSVFLYSLAKKNLRRPKSALNARGSALGSYPFVAQKISVKPVVVHNDVTSFPSPMQEVIVKTGEISHKAS